MISQETINRVKNISLVDLISETVTLKRAGSNFTGLCPFHQEKTPSFHVKADDNYYHCFGCGVSGDIISYVMQTQGLSYPETIEYLANRFKIPIVYDKTSKKKADFSTSDIYRLNAMAYDFYQSCLSKAPEYVKDYITKRDLSKESIEQFTIGYAPAEWSSLYNFLRAKKIPDKLMLTSGLIKQGSGGKLYDTFRDRLLFPVWYDNHRIAGFGGRIIREDPEQPQAKYLNSPETPVYQKSKIFYGLPQALETIRAKKTVYIVEGYLDVIGLHQVGVKNVIATCGTALTKEHVKRLAGLVKRTHLLFDGDNAGRKAAAKCFAQMSNFDAEIETLFLPDGQDPDDFSKLHAENTASELANLERHSLLECFIKDQLIEYQVSSVQELGAVSKSQIAEKILKIIAEVENRLVASELKKQTAFTLMLEEAELNRATQLNTRQAPPQEEAAAPPETIQINVAQLDQFNRTLLQAAMIARNTAPERILKSADLCEFLHPNVIGFIDALHKIIAQPNSTLETQKQQTTQLLQAQDPSWIEFWKTSNKIHSDPLVQSDEILNHCLKEALKRKIQNKIKLLEEQIIGSQNTEEKARLLQTKLEENRKLQSVINA